MLPTSTYEHKEGTTDGKLPTNASLKMMNWDETKAKSTATEAKADPTHLAYFNNHGTPVNVGLQHVPDCKCQLQVGCIEQG